MDMSMYQNHLREQIKKKEMDQLAPGPEHNSPAPRQKLRWVFTISALRRQRQAGLWASLAAQASLRSELQANEKLYGKKQKMNGACGCPGFNTQVHTCTPTNKHAYA